MNIEERKEKNKQLKKYEKLGALKFQKMVFTLEKYKFKILKAICPNFLKHYDKYCDRQRDKALKKAKTEEEIKEINTMYKFIKMEMRKEFYQEKNRNYHIDSNNPTEIVEYLNWNKSVHIKGLRKNAIVSTLSIILIAIGIPIAGIPLLICEIIGAGINFECINIQNYNLCRCEIMKDFLEKRQERNIQRKIEKYGEASEVIYKSIEENQELPSFDQIIGNINNIEQLRQMRELLIESQAKRGLEEENKGVKKWA